MGTRSEAPVPDCGILFACPVLSSNPEPASVPDPIPGPIPIPNAASNPSVDPLIPEFAPLNAAASCRFLPASSVSDEVPLAFELLEENGKLPNEPTDER
jgi:hypothetical protein